MIVADFDRVATRILPITLSLMLLAGNVAECATITVTSASNVAGVDGACSLVEAINAANANVGGGNPGECAAGDPGPAVDTIAFAIPGAGVHTIALTGNLPPITEKVTIDGYTQPGASANTLPVGDDAKILIELDGSAIAGGMGLSLSSTSSGSTVRGLALSGFAQTLFIDTSNNNTIEGNFIGADTSGLIGSATASWQMLLNFGTGNHIGGSTPAARNVFGPASTEILFQGASGNYIGIDVTGNELFALGPGNFLDGIKFFGSLNNVSCNGNLVGGTAPGEGNVIAVPRNAITLGDHAFNNSVQGNLIGTNASGSASVGGNTGAGILGAFDGNIIGGAAPGAGNLISGGTIGISISQPAAGWIIKGNRIGTDISGRAALGNAWCGIYVSGAGASASQIGGTEPGAGNTIAFNGTQGIFVDGSSNWSLLGNAVFGNGDLGIALGNASCSSTGTIPLANDSDDSDTGSNNRQNYPAIGSVTVGPKTVVHVSGSLNSTTSTLFRVEFFANAKCDDAGNGEGKIFIGSTDVTTSPNDVAFGPFDLDVPGDRHVITATATDPAGNTSEFSACDTQDTIFSDAWEGS